MPSLRIASLTALTMAAFAANSLLCRLALKSTAMDAASFTAIRLVSGALMLWLAFCRSSQGRPVAGNWPSAIALFVYAAGFSFAYLQLPTAVGALVMVGAVQVSMIGYGLWKGERLRPGQIAGLALALGGLVYLLMPGLSAPPAGSAILMGCAGAAWGVYSLRGRQSPDPTAATAGNFLRAAPLAIILGLAMLPSYSVTGAGVLYAIASGAVASALAYALWYAVLPKLPATIAAILHLSVPVLAALLGVPLLHEPITPRLAISSLAILGGIAWVIAARRPAP